MGKSVGYFKANSKALAENESDGIAKVYFTFLHITSCFKSSQINMQVLFNKKTEEILGVHIIGIHAADLIQECANAVAAGTTVRELSMMV
jgi:dihydrolipoamide dehydrogenase